MHRKNQSLCDGFAGSGKLPILHLKANRAHREQTASIRPIDRGRRGDSVPSLLSATAGIRRLEFRPGAWSSDGVALSRQPGHHRSVIGLFSPCPDCLLHVFSRMDIHIY